jgi:MFS family permease
LTSLWAPLQHRNFRLLWAGFVVSHVGDFIQILAQSWLVVGLTRSATRVAAVALAQALPRLAIGLFAGVVVDRVDRRRLLLVTQTLAAAQSALFLGLVLAGRITYAWVLGLSLALGVFDALNLTARQAMLPGLVPREMIPRAVALQALGVNVTQIAGPSLGGVLLGSLGVQGCLAVNVLSFGALIGAVAALRLPPSETNTAPGGVGEALREGFAFIRARPALWASMALLYALGVLGMPVVRLLPLWARVVLDTTGRGYGLLACASGLGALAASVAVTSRAHPARLPRNVVAAGAAFAVGVALFSRTGSYAASFAALALVGGAQMAFRSAAVTIVQLEVPDRLRGRVLSVMAMDFALWSVGAVGVGLAVDAFARGHAQLGPDVPRSLLPPSSIAAGLRAVFLGAGVACAAALAVWARPLLAARRGHGDGATGEVSR